MTGLRRSYIRERAETISKTLQQRLANPEEWPLLKSKPSNIRISQFNLAWLSRLESETGLRSHNETLTYLIESARRENMVLPASLKLIFHDDRPVFLSGPSGSGKSLFLKTKVLPNTTGPIFLIDLAGEYQGLKKLGVGDFFEVKWVRGDSNARLRFVPSSNLDVSRGELRTIFSHLNMVKMDQHHPEKFPSGVLSNWTIIVEESHRLARESAFLNFLSEGRKFTRKIVTVASDPLLFGSICRLVKPPPLEELIGESRVEAQKIEEPMGVVSRKAP